LQESLKAFVAEMDLASEAELMEKQKDFNSAILMSKEVCEELKKILPPGQHLQALKLENAIRAMIEHSSEIYKLGVTDCMDYINYAIENEHYKTVNK
jgi:hypothetical protein